MPNYCNYSIKVSGYKDNVDEFIRIINYEYEEKGPYFARVFECDVTSEVLVGVHKEVIIEGYLAWSVYCCMMPGALSYYEDNPEILTNLIEQSKRLNLHIDVWGEETDGMFFQERYKIISGIKTVDWERPIPTYDLNKYSNVKDFYNQTGNMISQEEWKYRIDEFEGFIEDQNIRMDYGIFDNDQRMVKQVMVRLKGDKNDK